METLTPAQKAQQTRAFRAAYKVMDETVAPQQKQWEQALDRNCPIRDRYIAKLQAERDAAIAEINRKYEEDYAIQMAQFEHMMKPTQDAYDAARAAAWKVLLETLGKGE